MTLQKIVSIGLLISNTAVWAAPIPYINLPHSMEQQPIVSNPHQPKNKPIIQCQDRKTTHLKQYKDGSFDISTTDDPYCQGG